MSLKKFSHEQFNTFYQNFDNFIRILTIFGTKYITQHPDYFNYPKNMLLKFYIYKTIKAFQGTRKNGILNGLAVLLQTPTQSGAQLLSQRHYGIKNALNNRQERLIFPLFYFFQK